MFNSRPAPLTSEVRINTSRTKMDAEELKSIFRDIATAVLKETKKASEASERISGRRKNKASTPFDDMFAKAVQGASKAERALERFDKNRQKAQDVLTNITKQHEERRTRMIEEANARRTHAVEEARVARIGLLASESHLIQQSFIQQERLHAGLVASRRQAINAIKEQMSVQQKALSVIEDARRVHTAVVASLDRRLDALHNDIMQRRATRELQLHSKIEGAKNAHTRRMQNLEAQELDARSKIRSLPEDKRGQALKGVTGIFDRANKQELDRFDKEIASIWDNHRTTQEDEHRKYIEDINKLEALRVRSAEENSKRIEKANTTIANSKKKEADIANQIRDQSNRTYNASTDLQNARIAIERGTQNNIRTLHATTNAKIREMGVATTERLKKDAESVRTAQQRVQSAIQRNFSDTARVHLENSAKIAQQERATKNVIRNSMEEATKAVARFNMAKAKLGETLRHITWEMRIFAGSMAGFIFLGLRNADALELMETRYEALFGSMEEGRRQMDRLAVSATRMGAPVRATQRAFAGLIPSIQDANGSIDQYLNLALRLATLNPAEGLEGAVYSIREALVSGGSDLQSMVERFNIPRNTFKALVAITGDFGMAMDIMLESQGATTTVAEKNAKSIRNMTATIKDSMTQAFERAFIPMLETAQKIAELFNKTIQETPTWVLQLAGAFALVSGVLVGITSVGQIAYNTMSKLSDAYSYATIMVNEYRLAVLASNTAVSASGGAPVAGAVGGVTARVASTKVPTILGSRAISAGGTIAGFSFGAVLPKLMAGLGAVLAKIGAVLVVGFKALITGLAVAVIGFISYHLAKAILSVIDTVFGSNFTKTVDSTLRKALAIVGGVLILIADGFVRAVVSIVSVFTNLGNTLKWVSGQFTSLIGSAMWIFGKLFEAIEDHLSALRVNLGSEGLISEGERIRNQGARAIADAESAINNSWDRLYSEWSAPLRDWANDLVEWAEVADEATDAWAKFVNIMTPFQSRLTVAYAELLGNLGKQASEEIDDKISFAIELDRMRSEGTVDEIGGMIESRTREREVIRSMIPEAERWAKVSDEGRLKLNELNATMYKINQELPQLQEALDNALARDQESLRATFTAEQSDASDVKMRAMRDAYKKAQDAYDALDVERLEQGVKNEEKLAEIQKTYDDDESDRLESHLKKLRDIEKKYNDDVLLAQSRLDARGVASAIKAREDALAEADEELTKQQAKNREKLENNLATYEKELEDLNKANNDKRDAIKKALDDELWQSQATYNQRMSMAQANLNNELMLLQKYYDERNDQIRLANQRDLEQGYVTPQQQMVGTYAKNVLGILRDAYNELWDTYGTPIDKVELAYSTNSMISDDVTRYAMRTGGGNVVNNFTISNPNPEAVLDMIKRLVVRGAE